MSLFKVNRGNEVNLPYELNDGWAYFCTDTGSFLFDHYDSTNTLVRSKVNAEYADKLRYVQNEEPVDVPDGTLWIDLDAEGEATLNSVLYVKQILTEEQQAQARKNIGAAANESLVLSDQIVLNYPDNCRLQLRDCRRYGMMCTFTLQIFVDIAITDNYGFTLATLPVAPAGRVWINNETMFYMDQGNKGIRVNNELLATGNYIMTGFFFIEE